MSTLKDPEQSFREMLERSEKSGLPQAAYSFWRDDYYAMTEHHETFKKFNRWFDPSWTLPAHVQSIVDLYEKNFISHKIIVCDAGEGCRMHFNPSQVGEGEDIADWRLWKSWSHTTMVPFHLSMDETIKVAYDKFYDKNKLTPIQHPGVNPDMSSWRVFDCVPYTRFSFASSHIPHVVLTSDTRCFWILHDMAFDDINIPHQHIDAKVIDNIEKMDSDMYQIKNMKDSKRQRYFKDQLLSDMWWYLGCFDSCPHDHDWMPNL